MAAVAYPIPHDRRHVGRLAPRPELRFVPGGRRSSCPAARAHPAVYARRRAVAALLVGFLVGLAVVGVQSLLASPATTAVHQSAPVGTSPVLRPAAAHTHVVQPGESLWAVARQLHPKGDIRTTVAKLSALNGGAALQVGQVLVLP